MAQLHAPAPDGAARNVRSRSVNCVRLASGLLTCGLALGLVGAQLASGLVAESAPSRPTISLSSTAGVARAKVTVRGSGFPRKDDGWVFWDGANAGMPEVMTNDRGAFSASFVVPDADVGAHTVQVWITGATARASFTVPAKTLARAPTSAVVWSADMETGNLDQWTVGGTRGGPRDSGDCIRPADGVTREAAHSGRYAIKMTIDVSSRESGCRQFRHDESARGGAYFYSAWMMIPQQVRVDGYWNIFQFKSDNLKMNEAVWVVEARNRPNGRLHPVLRWKGLVPGPMTGEGTGVKYYDQALKDIPIGRWFHLEMFLRQSDGYDGRVTVWQDGVQLWDFKDVKTQYPGGNSLWSVNNYGDGLISTSSSTTIYVDDARISRTRVGPN